MIFSARIKENNTINTLCKWDSIRSWSPWSPMKSREFQWSPVESRSAESVVSPLMFSLYPFELQRTSLGFSLSAQIFFVLLCTSTDFYTPDVQKYACSPFLPSLDHSVFSYCRSPMFCGISVYSTLPRHYFFSFCPALVRHRCKILQVLRKHTGINELDRFSSLKLARSKKLQDSWHLIASIHFETRTNVFDRASFTEENRSSSLILVCFLNTCRILHRWRTTHVKQKP